jgi:hypothetical protein
LALYGVDCLNGLCGSRYGDAMLPLDLLDAGVGALAQLGQQEGVVRLGLEGRHDGALHLSSPLTH